MPLAASRHRPLRAIALLVTGWVVGAALAGCDREHPPASLGPDAAAASEEPPLAWVLVYYMAYDNDLDWAATPIFEALRRGLVSDRLAVVVIADGFGEGGMSRTVLRASGDPETTAVPGEGSAELATLERELAWVAEHLPAERYGVVLLDHGGRLDELGYDAHPEPDGPRWLRVPEVAAALRVWREHLPGRFELLMLQQCGKGSIENVYELRDTARVLVTSEVAVGAPNAYYEGALHELAARPDSDGSALARAILEAEPDHMFGAYSVVDTSRLAELGERLEALLAPLAERGPALRGAGWDLARRWVRVEGGGPVEVALEVAVAGRYVLATLSTSPVWLTLLDEAGREVSQTIQVGAVGGVDRLVTLDPGRYRALLGTTLPGGDGPVLVRLVPGPRLGVVYEPAAGEAFVDMTDWLESLYLANGFAPQPVEALRAWLLGEVVLERRVSATFSDIVATSGLSLLRPVGLDVLDGHADYALYRETALDEVHRLVLGDTLP